MGKASSAKKVARAAGLGGSRAYGGRPPWGYYFAVALLLVLGVVGVYNSREYRENKLNSQGNSAPTVGQSPPWFEGFAVDACGKLLPPVKTNKDPYGITTKGDGIIYIEPKVKSAAGRNATLWKFATSIGMTLNAGELEVPGGKLYTDGETCEGKPGHVYVMTWSSPEALPSDGVLQNKKEVNSKEGYEDTCDPDCNSGVLLETDQLVTIAFLPAPAKHHALSVLQPPASVVAQLTSLVANGGTTTTTAAVVPTTKASKATSSTTTRTGASSTTGTATSTSATSTSTTSPSTTTSGSTTTVARGTTTTKK